MTPEGRTKQAVTKVIRKYEPQIYSNMPVPCGYGESMLDYVGCAGGQFFMIETKKPGGKRTPRQSQCASRVERAGGKVFTITSADDPEIAFLEAWLVRAIARGEML